MLIYSERYFEEFSKVVTELFAESTNHVTTNNLEAFLSSITKTDGNLIIDCATADSIEAFCGHIDAIGRLMLIGSIKTIKILGCDSEEESLVDKLKAVGSNCLMTIHNEAVSHDMLQKLFMNSSPDNIYVIKEIRKPPLTTARSLSIDGGMVNDGITLMNRIYMGITGEATNLSATEGILKEVDATVNNIVSLLDETDTQYHSRVEFAKTIGTLVKSSKIVESLPSIIENTYSQAHEITSSVSNDLREALQRKEVLRTKEEIETLIVKTRNTYNSSMAELASCKQVLTDSTSLLASLTIPSQERLLSITDEAIGFVSKEEVVEIMELIPTILKKQSATKSMLMDKFKLVLGSINTIQASLNEVVKGYEVAVEASFNLVDSLLSTREIHIEVNSLTEKYATIVSGVNGTGVTNYALCTGVQIASSSQSCIIDLKESSPQMHYYCPDSIGLDDLVDMDDDNLEKFLDDHYCTNNTLFVPFPNIEVMNASNSSKRKYREFVIKLLHMLSSREVTSLVILDISSTLFSTLAKHVATVSIVTDTNISNVIKLSGMLKRCKKIPKLQQYNIVVTGISTVQPKIYLNKAGIMTGTARVTGVQHIPTLDDYKLSGKVYAFDYPNWRY